MTRNLIIIFIFAFASSVLRAQDINKKQAELEKTIQKRQSELENIQNTLQEKRDNLQKLKTEETQHLKKLYALDEQLNLNHRLITKINKQIDDINRLLEEMEAQLTVNQQDLEYRYEILNQRLVWIYKRSKISPLASALSADNPLQAARRLYMFSLLNKYDRSMIDNIEKLDQQIAVQKQDMENQRRRILGLKSEKQQQSEILSTDRQQRKAELTEVRSQKDAELKSIQQLDEDQNRLSNILETLMENKKILDKEAAAAFENLKGKLLRPVPGKTLRNFGKIKDLKYNTVINNPGIDIKAVAGEPVIASSSGEVAYISWLRGYGSFVILDHGGGYYSLYSHLDDILVETGQYITAGDMIATVGETGNLSEPILHFELRYGKEQLDPSPWLR